MQHQWPAYGQLGWLDVASLIDWIGRGSPVPCRLRYADFYIVFYDECLIVEKSDRWSTAKRATLLLDRLVSDYSFIEPMTWFTPRGEIVNVPGRAVGPSYLSVFPDRPDCPLSFNADRYVRRMRSQGGHSSIAHAFYDRFCLDQPRPEGFPSGGSSSTPPYDYAEKFNDF